MTPRASDRGEWGLIDAIRARLDAAPEGQIWSGDDAAVLPSPAGRVVFTTDVLVEGVDFDLAYTPADTIGVKALAVNASDIAAMGGTPRAAVASLTLRPDLSVDVVEDIADGLARGGRRFGVKVVGGDMSEARDVTLSVAMIGEIGGRPLTRSGARPGDVVCVTGALGGAAAGLRLLQSGRGTERGAAARLVARQLEPQPRVEEGVILAELGATAGIDISDGLVADLVQVLDASGVGCDLDPDAIPIDPDLAGVALPEGSPDPLSLALAGGEDFELLFTLPPPVLEKVRSRIPQTVNVIGTITEEGRTLGDRSLKEWKVRGWEHLRPR